MHRYLTSMRDDINDKLAQLYREDRVGERAMQHATAITAMIARWNLLREVAARIGAP